MRSLRQIVEDTKRNQAGGAVKVLRPKTDPAVKSAPQDDEDKPAGMCYFAQKLEPEKKKRLGLEMAKDWRKCLNKELPLGSAIVCPCTGCHSACSGYLANGEIERMIFEESISRRYKTLQTVDHDSLLPAKDNRKFNPSLVRFNGQNIMAYRLGWSGSRIAFAIMDDNHKVKENRRLELIHPKCSSGQEDPRLFVYQGKLYLAFAGLEYSASPQRLVVSQMLAELDDDLKAVKIWEPRYKQRSLPMEKNWGFFGYKDQALKAVYTIRPHKILVCGTNGLAEVIHETPGPSDKFWPGWTMRGGAAPILVGDEYYSFFHGWRKVKRGKGWYEYAVGVYTFSAEAPHKPLRCTRDAIWEPDHTKIMQNVAVDKSVIYPCGAVLNDGLWTVSAGSQDRECVVATFDFQKIESLLEPL